MRYRFPVAILLIWVTTLATGCSITSTWHAGLESPGPQSTPVKMLSKEQIEAIAKERIEQQYRLNVESFICDGPLQATIGATQRCIETAGGERIGLTLTVTNVEGNNVDFRFKIDDHLLPS